MESACKQCGADLLGSPKSFCNHSCSAIYNNNRRIVSDEQRRKTSAALTGKTRPKKPIFGICEMCSSTFLKPAYKKRTCSKTCNSKLLSQSTTGITRKRSLYAGKPIQTQSERALRKNELKRKRLGTSPRKSPQANQIEKKNCTVCATLFETKTKRKTCGDICHYTLLQKTGGNTKKILYTRINGETITLQSTWEDSLAKRLDRLGISWIRPGPLPWIDENNKTRMYFSDFYLPDFDIYLDPKNPHRILQDFHKLEYFRTRIDLLYGTPGQIMTELVQQISRRIEVW